MDNETSIKIPTKTLSKIQAQHIHDALNAVCITWGAVLNHASHCIDGCHLLQGHVSTINTCSKAQNLLTRHQNAYHNYRMTIAGIVAKLTAHQEFADRLDPDLQGEPKDA